MGVHLVDVATPQCAPSLLSEKKDIGKRAMTEKAGKMAQKGVFQKKQSHCGQLAGDEVGQKSQWRQLAGGEVGHSSHDKWRSTKPQGK